MADEDSRLDCRTDATKVVTTMLSCLVLKSPQQVWPCLRPTTRWEIHSALACSAQASHGPICWCQVSEHGINFTVNEAKSMQVRSAHAVGAEHPAL